MIRRFDGTVSTRLAETRECDSCGHKIDFETFEAAERFLTSSKWIETLQGYRCPVCVVSQQRGLVRRAPSLTTFETAMAKMESRTYK